jgi:hypothetical protein
MALQIAGATPANIAEVEANTKALRTVIRPIDFGSLGIYSGGGPSGVMAAGLAAAAPVFSWRWTHATNVAAVKRVLISAGGIAAFAAGVCTFNMVAARSFTVSDSGGTAFVLTTNNMKLRASMASTVVGDIRIASTATLTAGTRTLDATALSAVTSSTPATAGSVLLPPNTVLWDARAGEYPLVCAQNEGFVLHATVPATGTWTFSVSVAWEELSSY